MTRHTTTERIVFFGHEEYQIAPSDPASEAHARVASVARLIAKEAWRFVSHLTPRQRAQFDVDDLAQEAWLVLLEKDHHFDPRRFAPEKGGYVGFARLVLRQHFARTVHRSHAVHIPRRFTEPSSIASEPSENLHAAGRAKKDPRPIRETSAVIGGEPVVDEVEGREAASLARVAVRRALDALADHRHAAVLRRHYGLLGEPQRPVAGYLFRFRLAAEDEARELLARSAVAV